MGGVGFGSGRRRVGRLLPLGDGVVGQPAGQHQQTFVLAARPDARAQLADGAPAGRTRAELEADQAARRARPAPAQGLDVDGAFDALDERRRTEPLALQQHARQRLEGRRRQIRDAPFQRRRGPLAQRAPRLAEHLLGAFQLRVGRPTRQRVQTRARRTHPRAQSGAQPFARLGGQRRPHHAPRFVGLAVNQPSARRPVRDLANVHAASGRLPAQDLQRGVDRRHDPTRPLAFARAAGGTAALTVFGRQRARFRRARRRPLSHPHRRTPCSRAAAAELLRPPPTTRRTRAFAESPALAPATTAAAAAATTPPGLTARTSEAHHRRRRGPAPAPASPAAPASAPGASFLLVALILVVAVDFVVARAGGNRALVVFHRRFVLLIAGRLVAVCFENARFSQCGGARLGRQPGKLRLFRVDIRVFSPEAAAATAAPAAAAGAPRGARGSSSPPRPPRPRLRRPRPRSRPPAATLVPVPLAAAGPVPAAAAALAVRRLAGGGAPPGRRPSRTPRAPRRSPRDSGAGRRSPV